jgi:hypothetical protein
MSCYSKKFVQFYISWLSIMIVFSILLMYLVLLGSRVMRTVNKLVLSLDLAKERNTLILKILETITILATSETISGPLLSTPPANVIEYNQYLSKIPNFS